MPEHVNILCLGAIHHSSILQYDITFNWFTSIWMHNAHCEVNLTQWAETLYLTIRKGRQIQKSEHIYRQPNVGVWWLANIVYHHYITYDKFMLSMLHPELFVKYPNQWKYSSTQSAERVKCDNIITTHRLQHLCKRKWTGPQSLSVITPGVITKSVIL